MVSPSPQKDSVPAFCIHETDERREHHLHEPPVQEEGVPDAARLHASIEGPARIRIPVFALFKRKQIQREVRRDKSLHASRTACLEQAALTLNDDVRTTLDGRDYDVRSLACPVQAGLVAQVAVGHFDAATSPRLQALGILAGIAAPRGSPDERFLRPG